ncbi:class III signal peptide-containing protein [Candidatus Woesearchaeota archaeon]|nr:class III signal peptide-containing protein [Candidatus Woesearchaeota archaeon]
MQKRGQASVEYLILVGIMLALLIPLFYYSLTEISNNLRISQAENAVNLIAGKIDNIYTLGQGNRETVKIIIPKGTVSLGVIQNKSIELKLLIFGNQTEIFKNTKANNIIGNFPTESGIYLLQIEGLDNGDVKVYVK